MTPPYPPRSIDRIEGIIGTTPVLPGSFFSLGLHATRFHQSDRHALQALVELELYSKFILNLVKKSNGVLKGLGDVKHGGILMLR